MTRTYEVMFDLECNDLILQMFQSFFNIRKHHYDSHGTHAFHLVIMYERS